MPHHIQNLWLGGSPCFFKSCGSLKFWPTCSCTMTRPCHMRGQTVERLNFCVECPYFSVECLNFCVVPLPPKIYQFWIILVYFCTCSICVHANKGVPVIATAGHVGQLFEPISHGSWLHIYAGSQTCIGSSALPHVHRMISMHAWTKTSSPEPFLSVRNWIMGPQFIWVSFGKIWGNLGPQLQPFFGVA